MLKFISIALFFYALACFFLYIKQRDLLFFPTVETNSTEATSFWLETEQSRLKVWQFNEGKPAIIYFGGNAEEIEDNIPLFKPLFEDFTVYLVNYRGYGGSSGSPSEQALFEDALAVFDHLKSKHSSIHVIGRSLGSGVACYLSSQRPVEKLVLLTPYDSVQNVAQSHYPVFPVKWLIKDPFDSISRAHLLTNSILVLMAEEDDVVPTKHSISLIDALNNADVEAHTIKGTMHNNISNNEETLQYLKRYMSKS